MKVIVLGCGTSTGVPVIGCRCGVCTSANPKNKRTRSSVLVESGGLNILIDTSTDLRTQAIANNIERVDAVIYTHAHADHLHGIDDLRSFNLIKGGAIPCYAGKKAAEKIRKSFSYIFGKPESDGWRPELELKEFDGRFDISGVEVLPVEIEHGKDKIYGFRIGSLAYLTDCSGVPESVVDALKGVELLVLGALRQKPHPSHFSVDEAIDVSRKIGAGKTVLTHLGHNLDYDVDGRNLPRGVELGYDGMIIELQAACGKNGC